ncbi:MAG: hypothetical protein NVSMB2_16050 [Chloroflexota bacterium]
MSDDVQGLRVSSPESLVAEQRPLTELTRALQRITVLQQLTAALAETLTVDEVGAVVTTQGIAALSAQSGRIALVLPDGEHVAVVASAGYAVVQSPLRVDDPLPTSEVIRTGRPLFAPTHEEVIKLFPQIGQAVAPLIQGAVASTPLTVHGRVIGAMTLVFANDRDFDEGDRELLIAVAAQAAQAIERARLSALSLEVQADVRRSRDQLAAILGGIAEGVTVQDGDGRIIYANAVALTILGGARADEIESRWTQRFVMSDEEGNALTADQLPGRRLLRGESAREIVVEFRDLARGERRWSIVDAAAVRDDHGAVQLVVNIFRDITDRKRQMDSAAVLAEVGRVLGASLDIPTSLQQIAAIAVPRLGDWCIIDLVDERTPSSARRVAVAHANMADHDLADVIRARRPDLSHSGLEQAIRDGQPAVMRTVGEPAADAFLADPDRQAVLRQLDARAWVVVPLGARGHVLGRLWLLVGPSDRSFHPEELETIEQLGARVSLAIDRAQLFVEAQEQADHQVTLNTALREAVDERDKALVDLRQALRTRDEFLASVSHDLKNPLASIKAGAQLLLRRLDQPAGTDAYALRQGLQRVDAIATRAAGLVDELLDLARMQMGSPLELDRRSSDLLALVREVAQEEQQQTERHTITVETDCLELIGTWDDRRLGRVLSNLMDNAVKYSPDGGPVIIRVRAQRDEVEIDIVDHGIGIPQIDQARVFERFQRASNVERRIGGTGIGLASARHIIESHGGTISVSSDENAGSTFTLHIPIECD